MVQARAGVANPLHRSHRGDARPRRSAPAVVVVDLPTVRAATSDEVNDLRREAMALKEVVADLTLENRVLKKSVTGDGEDGE